MIAITAASRIDRSSTLCLFQTQHKTFHTSAKKKPVSADTRPPVVCGSLEQHLFASQDEASSIAQLKPTVLFLLLSDRWLQTSI